jgi:hypothetical protein
VISFHLLIHVYSWQQGPQLDDEPSLTFRRMFGMDGNNSLKRMADFECRVGDTRTFEESDYFLAPTFVDTFAHEVPSRKLPAPTQDDMAGVIPDNPAIVACPETWKAAAPDEKKKMWGIFDETGIYASACRHGQILWIADMIRSGEQLNSFPPSLSCADTEMIILELNIH